MEQDEMPIGLGMALAQNPEAMKRFALLSDAQQKEIVEGTHAVHSKEEMHRYVNSILSGQ